MATLTVRELIKELLHHDMTDPVFVSLGPGSTPSGGAQVSHTTDVASGHLTTGKYGVYLMTSEHLEIKD